MSTLQVANVHLESTGNNRIQYTGSNTITIYAGGSAAAVVNSTGFGINSFSGNVSFDTSTLFVDSVNNRVGVKTTSPVSDLHVYGSLLLEDGNADGPQLALASAGSDTYYIDNFSGDLRFYNGGTERVKIDASGNVGIGNTAPTHKLRVEGTASVTGAATFSNTVTITGDTTFNGAIDEKVYNLTGTALDPSNGTIQYKTLGGNVTLTDSISEGESMTLMIDDGTAYSITWPTMTWVNNGGSAPTLATTGYTVIALWKVSTTLYGALVGDGS